MSRDSDSGSDPDQTQSKKGSGDETELQLPAMEDFEKDNSPEHYTRGAAIKKKAKSSEG